MSTTVDVPTVVAMPWHVGTVDGCDGYAVIRDSDGSVAGCHDTATDANKQLAALYANEETTANLRRMNIRL